MEWSEATKWRSGTKSFNVCYTSEPTKWANRATEGSEEYLSCRMFRGCV